MTLMMQNRKKKTCWLFSYVTTDSSNGWMLPEISQWYEQDHSLCVIEDKVDNCVHRLVKGLLKTLCEDRENVQWCHHTFEGYSTKTTNKHLKSFQKLGRSHECISFKVKANFVTEVRIHLNEKSLQINGYYLAIFVLFLKASRPVCVNE